MYVTLQLGYVLKDRTPPYITRLEAPKQGLACICLNGHMLKRVTMTNLVTLTIWKPEWYNPSIPMIPVFGHQVFRSPLYSRGLKTELGSPSPESLTWIPSFMREPKAMASPKAQSTVLSLIMSILEKTYNTMMRYVVCCHKQNNKIRLDYIVYFSL